MGRAMDRPVAPQRRRRGRRPNAYVMTLRDFERAIRALGGLRPAARLLGYHVGTLRDYRFARRRVSAEARECLLLAVARTLGTSKEVVEASMPAPDDGGDDLPPTRRCGSDGAAEFEAQTQEHLPSGALPTEGVDMSTSL
jgi:hypothetical protein